MKIYWLTLILFISNVVSTFAQTETAKTVSSYLDVEQEGEEQGFYFQVDTFSSDSFTPKEWDDQPVLLTKKKEFVDNDYILAQSRLFVSQTGFGIKKGEIEYRNIEIFSNEMSFGVTDNITLGGGLYPALFVNIFTFKASINKDIGRFVHLSAGGQIFADIGGIADDSAGEGAYLGFTAASIGTSSHFINVAYNRWVGFDKFNKGDVFSLGGSFKVSQKIRLFTDFFFIFDDSRNVEFFFFNEPAFESQSVLNFGASWFNKFNKIDFGFFVMPYTGSDIIDVTLLLPIFSYSRRF